MRRWKRLLLLIVLLAGITLAPALILQRHRPIAISRLRSLGFPAADPNPRSLLFSPFASGPMLITPPYTFYAFGRSTGFGESSGALAGGRLDWMRSGSGASGSPARADGMIFYPFAPFRPSAFSKKLPAPGGIRVIDELAREILRTISPPTPVSEVLCQNNVLIAFAAREIYGFDLQNDKLLWRLDTGGTITTGPAGAESTVYVGVDGAINASGDQSHELLAIDVRSGRTIWRSPLPESPRATPAIDGHNIYCIAQDRQDPGKRLLCALNAKDGISKWQFKEFIPGPNDFLPDQFVLHSIAAENGFVCVSSNGDIFGIDGSSGKLMWSDDVARGENSHQEVGPPLVQDGFVFFAVKRGAKAIDCVTGKEVWNYHSNTTNPQVSLNAPWNLPPIIKGNLIVIFFSAGDADFVRLPVHLPPSIPSIAKPVAIWPPFSMLCAFILATGAAIWLRRIKAFIALTSLALAVLVLCAWINSIGATYSIGKKEFASSGKINSQNTLGLTWAQTGLTFGQVHLVWEKTLRMPILGDSTSSFWWTRSSPTILNNGICVEEAPTDLGLANFAWTHHSRPSGTPLGNQSETSLTLPHWFVITLLAIPPFAWLSGYWRDRRRYPKGHCTKCGYDLRATTDRCPECGQPISAPK